MAEKRGRLGPFTRLAIGLEALKSGTQTAVDTYRLSSKKSTRPETIIDTTPTAAKSVRIDKNEVPQVVKMAQRVDEFVGEQTTVAKVGAQKAAMRRLTKSALGLVKNPEKRGVIVRMAREVANSPAIRGAAKRLALDLAQQVNSDPKTKELLESGVRKLVSQVFSSAVTPEFEPEVQTLLRESVVSQIVEQLRVETETPEGREKLRQAAELIATTAVSYAQRHPEVRDLIRPKEPNTRSLFKVFQDLFNRNIGDGFLLGLCKDLAAGWLTFNAWIFSHFFAVIKHSDNYLQAQRQFYEDISNGACWLQEILAKKSKQGTLKQS